MLCIDIILAIDKLEDTKVISEIRVKKQLGLFVVLSRHYQII